MGRARVRGVWAVVGLAALAVAATAGAKPAVDPAVMAALNRMGEFLREQQRMHVMAEMTTDEVLETGQKIQRTGLVDIKARRPDRLVAFIDSDRKTEKIIYDGKSLTIFEPKLGYYASTPAPPTLRETVDLAQERYGYDFPLADLFTWGTDRSPAAKVLSATNVGVSVIKGTPCDHYAFHQADVDWELWIERGPRPVPCKQVITTITERTQPQHVSVMQWDLAPKLDDQMFTFKPPANTHQIELRPAAEAAGKPDPQAPMRPAERKSHDKGGVP
jgi:hypothetical protein